MKSNDYVKYLTEQIVSYMDQPKSTRKTARQEKKEMRGSITTHLFGLVPMAMHQSFKQYTHKKKSD